MLQFVHWSSSSMDMIMPVVSVLVVSLLMLHSGVSGSGLSLRSAAAPRLGQSSSLIPTNRRSWPATVVCCKNTTTKATSEVHSHTLAHKYSVLTLYIRHDFDLFDSIRLFNKVYSTLRNKSASWYSMRCM